MPLSLMGVGERFRIRTVGGSADVRCHLGDMGFVAGAEIVVVAEVAGSLIVGVQASRVALSRDLAGKILV